MNSLIPAKISATVIRLLTPLGNRLLLWRIKPAYLTSVNLILAIFASILMVFNKVLIAAVCAALAGLATILDGIMARLSQTDTAAYNLFRSTSNRYAEFFLLAGI